MLSVPSVLTPELAAKFATIALGHVTQEYPHKLDHIMSGPGDSRTPRDLHPIFFGSFDWHSCVHGYWLLATLRRLYPDLPQAGEIDALFAQAFTVEKVEAERAYLDPPSSRGFERPYGWAWLLKLQAELLEHDAPWAARLAPLAQAFAQRFRDFLPLATYPIRTGVHSSTAFALALAQDYAVATDDVAFTQLLRHKAIGWFSQDQADQAREPSGDAFLSPALMEAECMRRLLSPREFRAWFTTFLPDVARRSPASLFIPATVSDRSDGKIAHLDGLNFSRAWCWRAIAGVLDENDPTRLVALETADAHIQASLAHVSGDYMGEHWLASFALLALMADSSAAITES